MPRWAKVLIWVVVFAACAAAGAYVAAHTDPFPPGVDDPGARSTPPPTPSPNQVERWEVSIRGTGVHTFRVGGACRSTWGGRVILRPVDEQLQGAGWIRSRGRPLCDFPNEQLQAESVFVSITASTGPGVRRMSFDVERSEPIGSRDRAGFDDAVAGSSVDVEPSGRANASIEKPDGVGGTIRADVEIEVTCARGCVEGRAAG